MSVEMQMSQDAFLRAGGIFQGILLKKYKSGELQQNPVYQEYPKMLRFSRGFEDVPRSTETAQKTTLSWTEHREIFEDVLVHSEAEEERVLAGGPTSGALEEERQGLLTRARGLGIRCDPSWSSVRLRRELGEAMDAPAPEQRDELLELREKMARLQEIAELKAQVASMEAALAPPVAAVIVESLAMDADPEPIASRGRRGAVSNPLGA